MSKKADNVVTMWSASIVLAYREYWCFCRRALLRITV